MAFMLKNEDHITAQKRTLITLLFFWIINVVRKKLLSWTKNCLNFNAVEIYLPIEIRIITGGLNLICLWT